MSAPWTCVGVLLIFLSTVNSQEILNMETFQQGQEFTVTCNLNTMRITDADEVLVITMRRQTESDTAPVTIGSLQLPNPVERATLAVSRNWDVQGTATGTGLDAQLIASITGTTCEDAGNYTCAIVYKRGDNFETPTPTPDTISATARVQDMTLSVDKIELTYTEQEVINFTCRVDGPDNLVIQWYSQCALQNYQPWPFANDIQRLPTTDIPSAACGEKRHASMLRYAVPRETCFVQCRAGLPNQAYSLEANMSIASTAATTPPTPGGVRSGGSTDIGVIVGPIVGVLAVIIIVLLLVYFCWYRKRSKEDKYKDHEDRPDATSDGNVHAPPPVFFTKPSKEQRDEKDNSRGHGGGGLRSGSTSDRVRNVRDNQNYNRDQGKGYDDDNGGDYNYDDRYDSGPRDGSRDYEPRYERRQKRGDSRVRNNRRKDEDGQHYASTDISRSEDESTDAPDVPLDRVKPKPKRRSRVLEKPAEQSKPLHYAELDLKSRTEDSDEDQYRGRGKHCPVEYASIRV